MVSTFGAVSHICYVCLLNQTKFQTLILLKFIKLLDHQSNHLGISIRERGESGKTVIFSLKCDNRYLLPKKAAYNMEINQNFTKFR